MKTTANVTGFTAEGVFVKLTVPDGMDAALQGLTREVLRHQPSDIYWFAAQYFETLVKTRTKKGTVSDDAETRKVSPTAFSRQREGLSEDSEKLSSKPGFATEMGRGIAALAASTGSVAALSISPSLEPSAPAMEDVMSPQHTYTTTTASTVQIESGSEYVIEVGKEEGRGFDSKSAASTEDEGVVTAETEGKEVTVNVDAAQQGDIAVGHVKHLSVVKRRDPETGIIEMVKKVPLETTEAIAEVSDQISHAVSSAKRDAQDIKTEVTAEENLESIVHEVKDAINNIDTDLKQQTAGSFIEHEVTEKSQSTESTSESKVFETRSYETKEERIENETKNGMNISVDDLTSNIETQRSTSETRTEEVKFEANESSVHESRSSNYEINEDGETFQEEVTFSQESTTQHETVSKTWTMETTIVTTESGETVTIERLVRESPPLDVETNEEVDREERMTENMGEAATEERSEETLTPSMTTNRTIDEESKQVVNQLEEYVNESKALVTSSLIPDEEEILKETAVESDNIKQDIESDVSVKLNEFGLIDAEEARRTTEQISLALAKVEESLDKFSQEPNRNLDSEVIEIASNLEVNKQISEDSVVHGHSIEVDENGKEIVSSRSLSSEAQKLQGSVEVDENGKEIFSSSRSTSNEADKIPQLSLDAQSSESRGHSTEKSQESIDVTSVSEFSKVETSAENTTAKNDSIDDSVNPKTGTEMKMAASKEGSKDESTSELRGISSQVKDYVTDEDQATPRDDVESLRVDTPADETSSKGSSEQTKSTGSEEHGDPIIPPTVVISRTADVVELKDGEVNIVTQMEKEGLVAKGGVSIASDESESYELSKSTKAKAAPINTVPSSEMMTAASPPPPPVSEESDQSPKSRPPTVKAVGLTAVAATTLSQVAEKGPIEFKKVDPEVSNMFIQMEQAHTLNLLTPPGFTGDDTVVIEAASNGVDSIKSETVNLINSEVASALRTEETEIKVQQEKVILLAAEQSVDENGTPLSRSPIEQRRSSSKLNEVDENGVSLAEKLERSMEQKSISVESKETTLVDESIDSHQQTRNRVRRSISIDDDKKVEKATTPPEAVGTEKIVSKHQDNLLTVSRDSPQPCFEPLIIPVDKNAKKEPPRIDIFEKVSQASSAAGQAILNPSSESPPPVTYRPIVEGVDVMKEMSLATSRVGQSILALSFSSDSQNEVVPSQSEDEYCISKDALYIPLNPPGQNDSEIRHADSIEREELHLKKNLEKMDSNHERLNEDMADTMATAVVNQALTAVNPIRQTSEENPSPKIVSTTAIVENVRDLSGTPTQDLIERSAAFTSGMSDTEVSLSSLKDGDDDVLIVEYAENVGGVTNWDSVIVSSPDHKEQEEPELVQELPSIAHEQYEPTSQFSIDDSLQEVPSLQDEVVIVEMTTDEETNLIADEERKWTDDVSKAASKVKDMATDLVSGIMSAATSIKDEVAHLTHRNEPEHTIPSSIEEEIKEETVKATSDIQFKSAEIEQTAEERANSVVENTKENVLDTVVGVASDSTALVNQTELSARNAVSDLGHGVKDTFETMHDGVQMKDQELDQSVVESEIHLAKNNLNTSASSVVEEAKDISHTAQEIKNGLVNKESEVEQIISESIESAKESASKIQEKSAQITESVNTEISDRISEGKDMVSQKLEDVKEVVKEAEDIAVKNASEVVEYVDTSISNERDNISEGLEKAKATAEEAVKSVSEAKNSAVENSIQAVESVNSAITNAVSEGKNGVLEEIQNVKDTASDAGNYISEVNDEIVDKTANVLESVTSAVSDGVDKVSDGVESAKKSAKNAVTMISEFKDSVEEKSSQAVQSVKSAITDTISEGKEKISDGIEKAKDSVKEAAKDTVNLATDAKDGVVQAIESAGSAISEEKDKISGEIHEIKEGAKEAVKDAANFISDTKDNAVKKSEEVVEFISVEVRDGISEKKEKISKDVETAEDAVKETVKDAANLVSEAKDSVSQAIGSVGSKISEEKDEVSKEIGEAKETVKETVKDAENFISEAKEKVVEKSGEVAESVSSALSHTISDEKERISKEISKGEDTARDLVKDAENFISEAKEKVVGKSEEVVESVNSAVTQTISDEKEKISKEIKKAEDAIKDTAKDAVDYVSEAKDSASKSLESVGSKLSEEKGKILREIDETKDSVNESVKAANDFISGTEEKAVEQSAQVLESVSSTISNATSREKEKISEVLEDSKEIGKDIHERSSEAVELIISSDKTTEQGEKASDTNSLEIEEHIISPGAAYLMEAIAAEKRSNVVVEEIITEARHYEVESAPEDKASDSGNASLNKIDGTQHHLRETSTEETNKTLKSDDEESSISESKSLSSKRETLFKHSPRSDTGSWESSLRKSTSSSINENRTKREDKMSRSLSAAGADVSGKKTHSSHIPRMKKLPPNEHPNKTSSLKVDGVSVTGKSRPSLRKSKSLSESASDDSTSKLTKRVASNERRKRSEDKVVTAKEASTSEEKTTKVKEESESATQVTTQSVVTSHEFHTSETTKSDLVLAATTIQDTFRGYSTRPQPISSLDSVDDASNLVSARSFQCEPVLEETAEEMRGSQASTDRPSVDLEDTTSTSDSSLSSAATKIQAGFRGYLTRKNLLHAKHGTASSSIIDSQQSIGGDLSMSRDSDVGVVRAMSLMDDSEVQRHRWSPPLSELPGEKLNVSQAEKSMERGSTGKRGIEWTQSLDSGLMSSPVGRAGPIRSAKSMQGRDLDEHVWRTLERELRRDSMDDSLSDDPDERMSVVSMRTRRGFSTRQKLLRGNAVQLPTTSSSTPASPYASFDEPSSYMENAPSTRLGGEFHDMLVALPSHLESEQHPEASTRAGFSLNGLEDAASAATPTRCVTRDATLDMKTADAAAAKIQAGFRGYKVRRQLRESQGNGAGAGANNGPRRQNRTSNGIDAGSGARGDQVIIRGRLHQGYHPAGVDKMEKDELIHRSATCIQAGVRGFLVRRRQQNAAAAAAKIQAGFRGYRTRKDLKSRRMLALQADKTQTPRRQD